MLLSLLFQLATAAPAALPAEVVVVRHAEKASETARDPSLSGAGWARAAALDSLLADRKVTTVITTPFRRTNETASLVLERHGLTPMVFPVGEGGVAAHAATIAEVAKSREGVVLVVGHSNTVARIVAALGVPDIPDLCEAQYEVVFRITWPDGVPTLARERYGAADPPDAGSCPG